MAYESIERPSPLLEPLNSFDQVINAKLDFEGLFSRKLRKEEIEVLLDWIKRFEGMFFRDRGSRFIIVQTFLICI